MGQNKCFFLCVAQGGKLIANGTASAPIIMTSVADDIQPGQLVGSNLTLQQGLWGGLIVLGNAPISVSGGATAQIKAYLLQIQMAFMVDLMLQTTLVLTTIFP